MSLPACTQAGDERRRLTPMTSSATPSKDTEAPLKRLKHSNRPSRSKGLQVQGQGGGHVPVKLVAQVTLRLKFLEALMNMSRSRLG